MKKQLSFLQSLSIIVLILAFIFVSLFILKVEPHIPLLMSVVLLSLIGAALKYKWAELENGIIDGIKLGIKPILILGLIGLLIAIWMASGTIPTILSYGFNWVSPSYFLISALLITVIVSTFTGSTFTTVSTVGVALIGIGTAVGVHPGLAAGAIVSGAAFGDKMSPLSDTTNFASGIVGVKLFEHIRHMLWTTLPSLLITAIIFFVIGIRTDYSAFQYDDIVAVKSVLSEQFTISLWALVSPLLVLILSVRRVDVIPTLIVGILSGLVTALLLQQQSLPQLFTILQGGLKVESGNQIVDTIVNRGGLQSMMWSISLVMIALALGGLMRELGIVKSILEGLASNIRRSGDVVLSTVLSSIGVNVITGEQYLSILLPGQTFKPLYEKWQLAPKNLSRTLEDAGTLVNPLIPWGVSGAFIAQTLGVPVIDYLPYAFFLLLCPLISVILGYTGIGISKEESLNR
ncbi:Na+/H+ antiporter NhaC [Metabacillus iocasae]|uniref:NhaC family Na+:H+ antiporter n=1 Tax=Priestia iocasae TaxID=2291674 RepID=A0ABS2R0K1_9BACI|nr:Na+/H+ antiporter NhaC [Metabacillus iocasae]MBM7704742.1 NhaC family Na+:H+ antiporter [Metabacillus iocasae]